MPAGQAGQAGSAHLRSITLRRHMALSPPQWATAAKQAKCRQTFFRQPHIGNPDVTPHRASLELANLGRGRQGTGRVAGWDWELGISPF